MICPPCETGAHRDCLGDPDAQPCACPSPAHNDDLTARESEHPEALGRLFTSRAERTKPMRLFRTGRAHGGGREGAFLYCGDQLVTWISDDGGQGIDCLVEQP